MTRAQELIRKVRGMEVRDCHALLAQALELVCAQLPKQPCMKDVLSALCLQTSMSRAAVSKALSRAVIDLWEYGDRQLLAQICGYRELSEKPPPKELILALAQYMSKPIEYRLWQDRRSGKFGIAAADPVTGRWLALAPVSRSRAEMEAFVLFLNRVQAPFEDVQELLCSSELLKTP